MPPRILPTFRSVNETWNVRIWRYDELREAGYSTDAAAHLAQREDVDLHRAVELRRDGCEEDLALEILL